MSGYVIIGNGVAAVGCIEGIRSVDTDTKITVISAEEHPVYCRPLISYYLEGKTSLDKMNYRSPDFYSANNCDVVYGRKALKIEADNKTLMLDDGTQKSYDALCIATGSSPFVPMFPGLETVRNKFTFISLDDALSLEQAIDKNSRVLIVGAGLIGLKCAEGICGRVAKITVCDLATRVLSSILDNECAAFMQKRLEEYGISFMLGDTVKAFDGNCAQMNSGQQVDFDVLVLAVGVRANTALMSELGGEVNRSIIVNDKMQTSIEDIYAAGDCSEGNDISLGSKRVLAILPNAYMQGYCAGTNMAGKEQVFDNAIPMNSIGFFGLHAMSAGSYPTKEDGATIYEEKYKNGIKRFFIKDGLLKGYIIIGNVERAGIYTSLIRQKTPIDTLNIDLLKSYPSLAMFSDDIRKNKLVGVM